MIMIDRISKSFGDQKIIDDLSCEFHRNQITSVVAPNGMGKTTLISMISGLMLPDSGTIEFLEPLRQKDTVIVLAGEKNLYNKNTAEENILYFGVIRGFSEKEIRKRIDDYSSLFPMYDKLCSKRAEELSYGQKRLVALLSAVISDARCIIVDEASEGLDMEYVSILKDLFQAVKKDRIVILTSHDYSFVAEVSDRCLFLKDGKIVHTAEGASKEALVEEYRRIFGEIAGEVK